MNPDLPICAKCRHSAYVHQTDSSSSRCFESTPHGSTFASCACTAYLPLEGACSLCRGVGRSSYGCESLQSCPKCKGTGFEPGYVPPELVDFEGAIINRTDISYCLSVIQQRPIPQPDGSSKDVSMVYTDVVFKGGHQLRLKMPLSEVRARLGR